MNSERNKNIINKMNLERSKNINKHTNDSHPSQDCYVSKNRTDKV